MLSLDSILAASGLHEGLLGGVIGSQWGAHEELACVKSKGWKGRLRGGGHLGDSGLSHCVWSQWQQEGKVNLVPLAETHQARRPKTPGKGVFLFISRSLLLGMMPGTQWGSVDA